MTLDEYKNSIQEDINKVLKNNMVYIELPESSASRFYPAIYVDIDFEEWKRSCIIVEQDSLTKLRFFFDHVFNSHSDLYFGRKKTSISFNSDAVRSTYFALRSVKEKYNDIMKAEEICRCLSIVGAKDGVKRKISAVGKYFVNNSDLSSNAITKFQTTYKTHFTPDEFPEFKEAYILSYNEAHEQFEEEKEERQKSRRQSKDAVLNSYDGNIDELIHWIKNNIESISIRVPTVHMEDYDEYIMTKKGVQKSFAEVKEKVIFSTQELIKEAAEQQLVDDNFTYTDCFRCGSA